MREGRSSLSYDALYLNSKTVAFWLSQYLQLQPGERVIVQLPNGIHQPVVIFSLWLAGLVPVPISTSADLNELKRMKALTGAEVLITSRNNPTLADVAIRPIKLFKTISCSPEDFTPRWRRPIRRFLRRLRDRRPHYADFRFHEALDYKRLSGKRLTIKERSETAIIQLSSGTQGLAKAIRLSDENILTNVRQLSSRLEDMGVEGPQRLLMPLPLYHSYPFMISLMTLAQGGAVYMVSDVRDIDEIAEMFGRVRPTLFAGVAPIFIGLERHPLFPQLELSSLRCTFGGGATLNQGIGDQWQAITGKPIVQGYGLTECSPVVSLDEGDRFVTGVVGKPLLGTQIEIRDQEGHPLPTGSAGMICVKGPQVMLGYCDDNSPHPVETDGWLITGDIGRLDDRGVLTMIEREFDLIDVGGFRVFPSDIEAVISEHPDVIDCAVGRYLEAGETKLRLLVVTNNRRVTHKMIREYCRQRLTSYKVPHTIELRSNLPHSAVGRVLRHRLDVVEKILT